MHFIKTLGLLLATGFSLTSAYEHNPHGNSLYRRAAYAEAYAEAYEDAYADISARFAEDDDEFFFTRRDKTRDGLSVVNREAYDKCLQAQNSISVFNKKHPPSSWDAKLTDELRKYQKERDRWCPVAKKLGLAGIGQI